MKKTNFFERIMHVSEYQGYKNISDFARNGLNYSSPQKLLRLKEEGTKPSIDIILDISNKFESINTDWLLTGAGEMLRSKSKTATVYRTRTDRDLDTQEIPLYSLEASAGVVALFRDQAPTKDFISIPHLPKCDGALYINGDSMYPLLKSGDIVMYRQINDPANCIFVWGEMYLVSFQMDGDEYSTVKYIQKSEEGKAFVKLVSQNPNHQPMDIPRSAIKALAIIKASVRINAMN